MITLQQLMSTHQITPHRITYLIQEGIELERLKLEIHRAAKSESVESHITILEGERLVSLLDYPLDFRSDS